MSAGVEIGGVCIRSPFDREPNVPIDVVIERRGSAFGSGSHPTTQMCVALLLELDVAGAVADLGCGVGTLAIVAAKLGFAPVVGVDRVPVAIEVAHENVARNAVAVDFAVADLAVDDVPLAPLLLVNAPPPVHERVAATVDDAVRHVIVSGHRVRRSAGGRRRLRGLQRREGARDGGRVDRAAAESFLRPDRAATDGAALGQLACSLDDGGLLITASRLVEFGARAAILLAPGLFRLDLTPQEETLGLYPRVLGAVGCGLARRRGVVGRLPRRVGSGADRADRRRSRTWACAPGSTSSRSRNGTPWPRTSWPRRRSARRSDVDVDALLEWYERGAQAAALARDA